MPNQRMQPVASQFTGAPDTVAITSPSNSGVVAAPAAGGGGGGVGAIAAEGGGGGGIGVTNEGHMKLTYSYKQRKTLSETLDTLKDYQVEQAVSIIHEMDYEALPKNEGGEHVIDFQRLKIATLRRLDTFVTDCKKARENSSPPHPSPAPCPAAMALPWC